MEESALQLSLTDPASKGAVKIISNIFTVTQFDSIITVSDFSIGFKIEDRTAFKDFYFQTSDNGRVGNILSGYASIMVMVHYNFKHYILSL